MKTGRMKRLLGFVAAGALLFTGTASADYVEGLKAFRAKDYVRAADYFESEVSVRPNWYFAHYMLGVTQSKLGQPQKAMASLREAIEVAESDNEKFGSLDALGTLYAKQKQFDTASKTYKQALALKVTDPKLTAKIGTTWSKLGDAELGQRQFSAAATSFGKASAAGKKGQEYKHGVSCWQGGDLACAVKNLRTASSNGSHGRAREYYVNAALELARQSGSKASKQKLYQEAHTAATQLVRSAPSNSEYQDLLASAALGLKNVDEAIASYGKVLKAKPSYCPAYINLAQAYMKKKSWQRAVDVLDKGTQTCKPPDDALFRFQGLGYEKLGGLAGTKNNDRRIAMLEKAVIAHRKSIQYSPSNLNLRNMERAAKNLETARENKEISDLNEKILAENEDAKLENERIAAENAKRDRYNKIIKQEFGEEEEKKDGDTEK